MDRAAAFFLTLTSPAERARSTWLAKAAASTCCRSSYGFGSGDIGEAAGGLLPFFAPAPIGPSLTVLASSVPSAFFQYEPLASSFSVMSFMVAAFPLLEIEVLSVTLKTRDSFFPVIVNVFAFWSTAEIIP